MGLKNFLKELASNFKDLANSFTSESTNSTETTTEPKKQEPDPKKPFKQPTQWFLNPKNKEVLNIYLSRKSYVKDDKMWESFLDGADVVLDVWAFQDYCHKFYHEPADGGEIPTTLFNCYFEALEKEQNGFKNLLICLDIVTGSIKHSLIRKFKLANRDFWIDENGKITEWQRMMDTDVLFSTTKNPLLIYLIKFAEVFEPDINEIDKNPLEKPTFSTLLLEILDYIFKQMIRNQGAFDFEYESWVYDKKTFFIMDGLMKTEKQFYLSCKEVAKDKGYFETQLNKLEKK